MGDVVGDVAEVDAEADHRGLVADGVDARDGARDRRPGRARRPRRTRRAGRGSRAARGARPPAARRARGRRRPASSSASTMCEPMNPAPPVTRITARQATVSPRARRHPARAQRARRDPVGARADARGLHADRRRQRLHGRLGRAGRVARRAGRRRARAGVRRRLLRRADARRGATSCASWTATPPSTRASCRASPTRSARARCELMLGARRPVARGAWPLHARAANAVLAVELRRRTKVPLRDLGPMRAAPAPGAARPRHPRPPLRLAAGDGPARVGGRLDDPRGRRLLPPARRAVEGHGHGARDRRGRSAT